MRKCPNCGQETERTKDWACRWCAYPLLSESYTEMPQIYEQLREDRPRKNRLPVKKNPKAPPLSNTKSLPLTDNPEPRIQIMPKKIFQPVLDSGGELIISPIELTVKELYSLFAMRSFQITGVVNKIVFNDDLDVYYVIIVSDEKEIDLDVQCMFGKKYVPELNQLTSGQTVTVEGKYAGYIVNMLMRDCVLVR